MKRMLNKKLPMAVTCWILIIGMVLTASPAFSRESNSSRGNDRTHDSDRSYDRDGSRDNDGYRDNDAYRDSDRYRDNDGYRDRDSYSDRNGYHDSYGSNRKNNTRTVRVIHKSNVIPAIIATGIIAGVTFSLLNRNDAPASRVTTPGTCPTGGSPGVANGSLTVTVQLLNLRSGPGLNKPCVGQLHKGARLSIMGTSAGWYYVLTSGGVSGWVMAQYTAPVGFQVSG